MNLRRILARLIDDEAITETRKAIDELNRKIDEARVRVNQSAQDLLDVLESLEAEEIKRKAQEPEATAPVKDKYGEGVWYHVVNHTVLLSRCDASFPLWHTETAKPLECPHGRVVVFILNKTAIDLKKKAGPNGPVEKKEPTYTVKYSPWGIL